MILAQTESMLKGAPKNQPKTIPRQNMKDRNKAVEYEMSDDDEEEVNLPKHPPMPDFIACIGVPSLAFLCSQVISQGRASSEDFKFMKDIMSQEGCPEWSGYNTKKARVAGATIGQKAKTVYVPLINRTPGHPTTMNIAVKKGVKFVRENGQEVLYFTVDLQLYKVVIDLLFYQPSLFKIVVPICGGMHWLMNSIHAMCVLLSPALKPILASTFGSVDKMIQGKKYPQNFRALRLLAEVMLQGILDSNPDICTMDQLIKYLEDESKKSKTMKLWVDCFIKPCFIWCAFIVAAREQDLPLHHASAKAMLPY